MYTIRRRAETLTFTAMKSPVSSPAYQPMLVSIATTVAAILVLGASCTSEQSRITVLDGPPVRTIDAAEYVLKGGTIVDAFTAPDSGQALIWIRDGQIIFVGPSDDVVVPDSIATIDISGQYVIPGLMDLHVHLPDDEVLASTLRTLLGYGITTVRNAGTVGSDGVSVRERINAGDLTGPQILTAGRLIDGPGSVHSNAVEVDSEESARKAVREQAAHGVDFIKIYTGLDESLVGVIVDEAHAYNLKVLAHLGNVSWSRAVSLGLDGLTHSGPAGPVDELLPHDLRSTPGSWVSQSTAARVEGWLDVIDVSAPPVDTLGMTILQHGVEINPTLGLTYAMVYGNEPDSLKIFHPEGVPQGLVSDWTGKAHPFSGPLVEFPESRRDELYDTFSEIVRTLSERGALVTTGTDLGVPWMTPGAALHTEMLLLRRAGLTEQQVLDAATVNGAEALGISWKTGEVRAGLEADLVILSRNPIARIENTNCIELVIVDGVGYRPHDLVEEAGTSCSPVI